MAEGVEAVNPVNPQEQPTPVVDSVVFQKSPNPTQQAGGTNEIFPKPKHPRRKLIWILSILGVLILAGVATWYFKLYQPLLDRYNAASVVIKVKEGDTYVIEGAKVKVGDKEGTTDSNGKVTLSSIVAGSYSVIVTKDGYLDTTESLNLHRGDNDPVLVSMAKQPDKAYAVKGYVQDYVSGLPLVDVGVTLGTKTVKTDPSGAYTFEKVAPADIKLTLSKEGYLDKELPLTVADSDIATAKVPLVPKGQISFVSNRDGKRALYLSNYDGSDQKQFVEPKNEGEDFAPSFSPTTGSVFFSSTRDKLKSGYGSILARPYIASKDGKTVTKINDDVATSFDPIWSPDGQFAYFTGYSNVKMDTGVYRIYDLQKNAVIDIGEAADGAVFSLDSKWIAYSTNTSEDRPTAVTQSDGSTATVTTKVYLNVLKSLNVVTGERKTLAKREQGMSSIAFSSNSKAVSYEVVTDGTRHRYEVTIADGAEKEIPVTDLVQRQYFVSPDGKFKAFIDERDGKKDLFVVDAEGKNEKRLTTVGVVYDGQKPTWDAGSRYITFAIRREAENALYVVGAQGGESKKITDYYIDSQIGL